MKSNVTIKDLFGALLPVKAVKTWWSFLVDSKKFIQEVEAGDYNKKLHSVPFFAGCYSIHALLLLFLLSNSTVITWYDVFTRLKEDEKVRFQSLVGIELTRIDEVRYLWGGGKNELVDSKIRKKTGSVEATRMSEYLKDQGETELALSFFNLTSKIQKVSKYATFIERLLFPLIILCYIRNLDHFLRWKDTHEVSQQILLYSLSFVLPLTTFGIYIIPWYISEEYVHDSQVILNTNFLIIVSFCAFSYWKVFRALKQTYHNSTTTDIVWILLCVHLTAKTVSVIAIRTVVLIIELM